MIDEGAVSEIEWQAEVWKKQKLVIAFKHFDNQNWIDVRKWKPGNGDSMVKTGKGLMIQIDHWATILPLIAKMVRENGVDLDIQAIKSE